MKLDVTCMRYLSKDDYRVLQAVEMGMRNHEMVPVHLITNIARLRHGGSYKILSTLLRHKLVAHANNQYDGYRLSYMGFDILALRTLLVRGVITSVGSQIGVGKESDIFEALDTNGNEIVLKIHRLGRTSFRAVRRVRDYMVGKHKASWLYMSRLAAIKEYAFMRALHAHGFPTPEPIDQNRHVVAMSRIQGFPMAQIKSGNMQGAEIYFTTCMAILVRLAEHGLVHCDFNEFNLMIGDDGTVTLIDFPQMVATTHPNAVELFNRDVNGLMKFFRMKMRFDAPESAVPSLADIVVVSESIGEQAITASGLSEGEVNDLQQFIADRAEDGDGDGDEDEDEDEDNYSEPDLESLEISDPVTAVVAASDSTTVTASAEDGVIAAVEESTEGVVLEDLGGNSSEEDDSGSEEEDATAGAAARGKKKSSRHKKGNSKQDLEERVKMELKSKNSRWTNAGGSRNMTKKRTKYGKIDKSAGRTDHMW